METPWYTESMSFTFELKQKTALSAGCNHNCFCFLQIYHVEPPVSQVTAPVIYMWRPSQLPTRRSEEKGDCGGNDGPVSNGDHADSRKLWVWIHASSFSEGYASLKLACQKQVISILIFPFEVIFR